MPIIVIAVAVGLLQVAAQGLQLNQGQSVRFSFTGLDFLGPNTNTFSVARAGLGFFPPGMSGGESLRMEFYPSSGFAGIPFSIQSITVPASGIFYGAVGFSTPSSEWDDLDGGVQITAVVGSLNIANVFFDVNRAGERFFSVQAVPEPSTTAFCALAAAMSFIRFVKRHRTDLFCRINKQ